MYSILVKNIGSTLPHETRDVLSIFCAFRNGLMSRWIW
jgi:hypothetical protein